MEIASGSFSTPWYDNYENITTVEVEDEIAPVNLSYWFAGLKKCTNFDLTKLNTLNVTKMVQTFANAGGDATTFNIIGLNKWNTSNVTNMGSMFNKAGYNADYSLNLSDWNVCNVTVYSSFEMSVALKITAPNWSMACPT